MILYRTFLNESELIFGTQLNGSKYFYLIPIVCQHTAKLPQVLLYKSYYLISVICLHSVYMSNSSIWTMHRTRSSTIFKSGTTRPGTEPWSSGPLANTLTPRNTNTNCSSFISDSVATIKMFSYGSVFSVNLWNFWMTFGYIYIYIYIYTWRYHKS